MQEKTQTFYHILPNGAKIVCRKTHSPVVYVGIMVGAGTRNETPACNGIAHYIEHCVFKGCTLYSSLHKPKQLTTKQIIDRVEGIGGEINAYTTKEETTFYAAVPKQYLYRTLQLLSAMVLHPTFPKRETDKELGVIYDEIESYNDSPSELIYDDFEALLFNGHPLCLPILGTQRTLKHIASKPDYALQFMAQHYRPERMVFFCQGDIKAQAFQDNVNENVNLNVNVNENENVNDNDNDNDNDNGNKVAPGTYAAVEKTYKKHTHQAHVMLGARAYEIGNPKQLGLYLLNNILGGGSMCSRLNMSIREKHGLVYTIESQYTPLSDTGYWSIYYATEPCHRDQCRELVMNELKRLREEELSTLQLHRALRQIKGQMAISAENRENNALAMAKLMLYHNTAPTWQQTYQQLQNITPKQLIDIAQEVFDERLISTLIYG